MGAAAAAVYGVLVARMSFGALLVVLGLGGMTLVLAGVALFRMLDPLLRDEGRGGDAAAQTPTRLRELERDKQAVLKSIREIELDHQMRKISDADYHDLVQRYRGRAMRLIRELDAGGNFRTLIEQELKSRVAAAETAMPHACPRCAVTNDPDAVFCKKCGQKL